MSDLSRLIVQVAKSDMSREALSHWKAFRLPAPNENIDALVAKLAEGQCEAPQDNRWSVARS